MSKKKVILSRYKERDDSFFDIVDEEYSSDIIIYDKDPQNDGYLNPLPNRGRESHTYIHYILENYDRLPDEMLFSQYSPRDHFNKPSVEGRRGDDHIRTFLNATILDFICINPIDFNLKVRGKPINWIYYYKLLYNKTPTESQIKSIVAAGACLNGIFRVTKEAVLRHKKERYERAYKLLSQGVNPYSGFFFERIWRFMFTNQGHCPIEYSHFKNKVFLFGHNLAEPRGRVHFVADYRMDWHRGHIKLSEDGTLCGNGTAFYSHPNESYWTIEGDTLYILAKDYAVTHVFDLKQQENPTNTLFGDDYGRDGTIHKNCFLLNPPLWEYFFNKETNEPR